MTPPMLAAVLDGRMVVLDARNAQVMLLDQRSERIWRACVGRSAGEVAAIVREGLPEVSAVLDDLAAAGLLAVTEGRWTQAAVQWV